MNKFLTTASRPQNSSARVQDVGVVNVAVTAWQLPVVGIADVLVDGLRSVSNSISALRDRVALWSEQRRTYAELDALDDRMLADIGLSRCEIEDVAASRTGAADLALPPQANDDRPSQDDPRIAA